MFYLSVSITLIIGALAVYIYVSESEKRIKEVEQSVIQVMEARNDQFTAVINGYIEQARLYSEKPEINTLNKTTLPETLTKIKIGEAVRSLDIVHKDGTLTNPGKHSEVDLREREYYKDIFERKIERSIFTIKSEHTGGDKIMGIVLPMKNNENEVIAGMILTFDLAKLSEMILSDMSLLGGETFIVDEDQKVIMHTNKDYILEMNLKDIPGEKGLSELIHKLQNEKIGQQSITYTSGSEFEVFFKSIENTGGWDIGFNIPYKSIKAPVISMLVKLLVGFALAVFICLLVIWQISSRLIVNPIKKVMNLTNSLANGNLNIDISSDQNDEIGQMTRAMVLMVKKLREIVGSIISASGNLSSSSQELSNASQQLAQGSNEQASSIEEVSSTMEQITSNINQSTDNANQTALVSEEANIGIKKISERSNEAVEANKSIAEKIQVINDIAFQTNLLALNAAVEAARAGEQGKGFAVVAAEVRKLAENSQKAADEIVRLAESSLNTSILAGEVMAETIPKIENAFDLVQEIAAVGNEQKTGTAQVNEAIQQLNRVTQQNAAASEELASNSEQTFSQAQMLKEVISFFKLDTNKANFKGTIGKRTKFRNSELSNAENNLDIIKLTDDSTKRDNDFEGF